jgi:hypothetical protein
MSKTRYKLDFFDCSKVAATALAVLRFLLADKTVRELGPVPDEESSCQGSAGGVYPPPGAVEDYRSIWKNRF